MRYIKLYTIIIFIVMTVLVCGCTNMDNYIPIEEYNNEVALYENQLEEANSETEAKSIEILELQKEVDILETDLDLTGVELEKYRSLINNLNELLSNIYIGYAENENWESEGFTAFSIEYKGNYYLITAGHCVHYKDDKIDTGVYTYFKFKANFSDEYIYPELLVYSNDYIHNNDYAILYSDKINNGLIIGEEGTIKYILGNVGNRINIVKNIYSNHMDGECGSPIINNCGEVMGILMSIIPSEYTTISKVTEAIDNLE